MGFLKLGKVSLDGTQAKVEELLRQPEANNPKDIVVVHKNAPPLTKWGGAKMDIAKRGRSKNINGTEQKFQQSQKTVLYFP